jgi:hypothetical protein
MNTPTRTFKSLKEGALDIGKVTAAVQEVAKQGNIPTLSFPKDAAAPSSETAPVVPASPPSTPATEERTEDNIAHLRRAKAARKSNPAPLIRVAVDLPDYLVEAIATAIPKRRVTKRYLFLEAFRAAGFTIHDVDMIEDGRRGS